MSPEENYPEKEDPFDPSPIDSGQEPDLYPTLAPVCAMATSAPSTEEILQTACKKAAANISHIRPPSCRQLRDGMQLDASKSCLLFLQHGLHTLSTTLVKTAISMFPSNLYDLSQKGLYKNARDECWKRAILNIFNQCLLYIIIKSHIMNNCHMRW